MSICKDCVKITCRMFGNKIIQDCDRRITKEDLMGLGESACKGCGKPILWAKNELGKNIPLDKRAPVYEIKKGFDGQPVASLVSEGYYVSHFSTCSKANQFSSSNRKPLAEGDGGA